MGSDPRERPASAIASAAGSSSATSATTASSRTASRLVARDRPPAALPASARHGVAALALLARSGRTACSSPPPAPPRQPIVVDTSVSTRYYPVRGTTTPTIFAAIDANGLVERPARAGPDVLGMEADLRRRGRRRRVSARSALQR